MNTTRTTKRKRIQRPGTPPPKPIFSTYRADVIKENIRIQKQKASVRS